MATYRVVLFFFCLPYVYCQFGFFPQDNVYRIPNFSNFRPQRNFRDYQNYYDPRNNQYEINQYGFNRPGIANNAPNYYDTPNYNYETNNFNNYPNQGNQNQMNFDRQFPSNTNNFNEFNQESANPAQYPPNRDNAEQRDAVNMDNADVIIVVEEPDPTKIPFAFPNNEPVNPDTVVKVGNQNDSEAVISNDPINNYNSNNIAQKEPSTLVGFPDSRDDRPTYNNNNNVQENKYPLTNTPQNEEDRFLSNQMLTSTKGPFTNPDVKFPSTELPVLTPVNLQNNIPTFSPVDYKYTSNGPIVESHTLIPNREPEIIASTSENSRVNFPTEYPVDENKRTQQSVLTSASTPRTINSGNINLVSEPTVLKPIEGLSVPTLKPLNDNPTTDEIFQSTTQSPSIEDMSSPLPVLTPLPISESRTNTNFGYQGIFKETCDTVEGEIGSCISLLECTSYVELLKQAPSNPTVVNLLRRAHCGFEGNNPKVCCPRPGFPVGPPTAPPTTTSTTTTTTTTTTPAPSTPEPKTLDGDFMAAFPEPPVCGVSNASFSRVVGGYNAKLGDFPWMALLGYKRKFNPWLCGGSLIGHHHVLTAAHCIHNHEKDLYVVRLGELDLAREDEGATPLDVLIKTMIKHTGYSPNTLTDDIGVLVLEKDVQFTELIKPICLPRTRQLRSMTFEDYNPFIAGWGDTEFRGPVATHLQALQLPVVSNKACVKAYSSYKNQVIDQRVLCAGYEKGGKDACQGDSGGPLMQTIYDGEKYTAYFYQIGVVSYGRRCADAGFPGVYTRTTHFMPWLEEKVLGITTS